jgi:hypothetical protein
VIQKILEHLERQAREPPVAVHYAASVREEQGARSIKHRAVRVYLRIRKQLRETPTRGLEVLMHVDAELSGLSGLKWMR